MKYRVSDRGRILLVEKREDLFDLLNRLAYSTISEHDKNELTGMLFKALTAAGVLEFNAVFLKTFKTAKGNMIAIIPYERDYITGEQTADYLLGEVQIYFDEFIFMNDKKILDLCKLYLKLKPFLSKQNKKKLTEITFDKKYDDRGHYLYRSFIYEIPIKDMNKLIPYAECFFRRGDAVYIKTNPGVLLDDFYERADIREKEYKKIEIPTLYRNLT